MLRHEVAVFRRRAHRGPVFYSWQTAPCWPCPVTRSRHPRALNCRTRVLDARGSRLWPSIGPSSFGFDDSGVSQAGVLAVEGW